MSICPPYYKSDRTLPRPPSIMLSSQEHRPLHRFFSDFRLFIHGHFAC
ncbi:MAG: hypothetical protein F6K55_18885 [Moorea sp. SIO4A3]|nr:hypothetical protein [Moorena sp. SIO4A3]